MLKNTSGESNVNTRLGEETERSRAKQTRWYSKNVVKMTSTDGRRCGVTVDYSSQFITDVMPNRKATK